MIDLFEFAVEGLWQDARFSAYFGCFLPSEPVTINELNRFRYQAFNFRKPEIVEGESLRYNTSKMSTPTEQMPATSAHMTYDGLKMEKSEGRQQGSFIYRRS